MSIPANEFEWTFPCYTLAKSIRINEGGELLADLAAATLDGESCHLIFTDLDLAERFRADRGDDSLRPIPLDDARSLLGFVYLASQQGSKMLVVDLDGRTHLGRKFYVDALLDRLRK
jgi:hypothetical protein